MTCRGVAVVRWSWHWLGEWRVFCGPQVEKFEVAIGQTPNQMDGVIKTRHEGGEPSEDFVMLSSDLIMPVYSYICGMCK